MVLMSIFLGSGLCLTNQDALDPSPKGAFNLSRFWDCVSGSSAHRITGAETPGEPASEQEGTFITTCTFLLLGSSLTIRFWLQLCYLMETVRCALPGSDASFHSRRV